MQECVYGCAYTARLWFEYVRKNYGNIPSLCIGNTVVLPETSLLRKDIGKIVNMLKTVV
jgi:hypothetical protein